MSYLEQYKATQNADFYGRVQACLHKTAIDVENESISTAGHTGRLELATRVLHDDQNVLKSFVWQCAMNATIAGNMDTTGASSSPDSDFEFVISSAWDTVVSINPPIPSTNMP